MSEKATGSGSDYLPVLFVIMLVIASAQYNMFETYREQSIVVQVNFASYSSTVQLKVDSKDQHLG